MTEATTWPIAIPGVEYYYVDDYAAIIHGDSLEILPSIPDNAFDLCLTDPPYGNGTDYAEYEDSADNLGLIQDSMQHILTEPSTCW